MIDQTSLVEQNNNAQQNAHNEQTSQQIENKIDSDERDVQQIRHQQNDNEQQQADNYQHAQIKSGNDGQQQNMNTGPIYRKKSELVAHLKLKTYDVNEDQDQLANSQQGQKGKLITMQLEQLDENQVQNHQNASQQPIEQSSRNEKNAQNKQKQQIKHGQQHQPKIDSDQKTNMQLVQIEQQDIRQDLQYSQFVQKQTEIAVNDNQVNIQERHQAGIKSKQNDKDLTLLQQQMEPIKIQQIQQPATYILPQTVQQNPRQNQHHIDQQPIIIILGTKQEEHRQSQIEIEQKIDVIAQQDTPIELTIVEQNNQPQKVSSDGQADSIQLQQNNPTQTINNHTNEQKKQSLDNYIPLHPEQPAEQVPSKQQRKQQEFINLQPMRQKPLNNQINNCHVQESQKLISNMTQQQASTVIKENQVVLQTEVVINETQLTQQQRQRQQGTKIQKQNDQQKEEQLSDEHQVKQFQENHSVANQQTPIYQNPIQQKQHQTNIINQPKDDRINEQAINSDNNLCQRQNKNQLSNQDLEQPIEQNEIQPTNQVKQTSTLVVHNQNQNNFPAVNQQDNGQRMKSQSPQKIVNEPKQQKAQQKETIPQLEIAYVQNQQEHDHKLLHQQNQASPLHPQTQQGQHHSLPLDNPIITQPSNEIQSNQPKIQPSIVNFKIDKPKTASWKSRKLQKPNATQSIDSQRKVVRNHSLHNLVMDIHKTQKDPIKLPAYRPSHLSSKKIRGKSPNLNRLKHSIGLQSKIIDLTVGQIFEHRHKRNDEMKSMLLKQISTLKQQITQYESLDIKQQNANSVQNSQIKNIPTNKITKQQQSGPSSLTYRDQHSQLKSKRNLYYTPRLPKFPQIGYEEVSSFDNRNNLIQDSSFIHESPQSYKQTELVISPQKRGIICGKIFRKSDRQALLGSNLYSGLNDSRFMNGQEQSFISELNSNQILESPSRVSRGSKFNSARSQKKIGSIISLKQTSRIKQKKHVMQSEVNAPKIEQLQTIPLPQKFNKTVDWQNLKQNDWKQLQTSIDQQFDKIILTTQKLKYPTNQSSQQQLVHFAHSTFFSFGINIQSEQMLLNIKRYKNCIIFYLNNTDTIIYHFDNRIYFGGWNGTVKQNWGLEITQSHIYKGNFRNNKKHGVGIMRMRKSPSHSDKALQQQSKHDKFIYYLGNWQNNYRHGYGIQVEFTQNHVIQYRGNWSANKKTGKGNLHIYSTKTQQHIQTYSGQLLNGLKHGSGTQTFANGDTYQGEYNQNKFQGKGKYTWKNGACYIGDFIQGMREGKGQWLSQASDINILENLHINGFNTKLKGDYYKGEYKNDKKNGFGIYRWKNGTIYEGQFQNDEKKGQGSLIFENNFMSDSQAGTKLNT